MPLFKNIPMAIWSSLRIRGRGSRRKKGGDSEGASRTQPRVATFTCSVKNGGQGVGHLQRCHPDAR